jgi:hypothetical protein
VKSNPETQHYLIRRHKANAPGSRIGVQVILGHTLAESMVDELNRKLNDEERAAGWSYSAEHISRHDAKRWYLGADLK